MSDIYKSMYLDADNARTRLAYQTGILLAELSRFCTREEIETIKKRSDELARKYMSEEAS